MKPTVFSDKPKVWYTFVGRLDPETTAEVVSEHLADMGISVVECRALQKKKKWHEKYTAFRIVMNIEHKDRMFDDDVWPAGTDVRDWVFVSKSANGVS